METCLAVDDGPAAGVRLNRFLAQAGLGSRRSVEALIEEGRVEINGEVCRNLATRVQPDDLVKVDRRRVSRQKTVSLLLNKPRGIVCTLSDELGRDTILDLLPPQYHSIGLHHVGRLDKESEGLLVLTNDGELSNQLTHPRHKVEKEYLATLDRTFDLSHKPKLLNGVVTPEGKARAESVWGKGRKVNVVLTQGMKRQIRHMFAALGYEVRRLQRIRIGKLTAPGLKPGAHSTLRAKQIERMLERKPG